MVYECGTEDLQVSNYTVIPPQIADIAGRESKCRVERSILIPAAARQPARNRPRRGSLRGNPPASVQQLEMQRHSFSQRSRIFEFKNGPRREALSNLCIIEKEKGEVTAPGIAHEGARVQFAPGDLAGRTTTSIWVYAQLERSRMVR